MLPAKAGPIKRSSCVLKPFSPVPTKNMIEPREIVPKPKSMKPLLNCTCLCWPIGLFSPI